MARMPRTLDDLSWPVRTERLTLRRARAADAEVDLALPAARRGQHLADRHAVYAAEEYAARFAEPDRLAKTLLVELDGQVVGDLYLAVEDGWAQAEVAHLAHRVQAELGWALAPAYQGTGMPPRRSPS